MGTRIFFGYDAEGKSFVYDLDMQLEQSPNLFLWNFQKEVMVKCNRSEIIEICDDPRVTDTHIDAYKEWKGRFGNDWLEKEKSFYDKRHQQQKELTLEEQLGAAEKEQLREAEVLRQSEIKRIVKENCLTRLEADELHKLLIEMRPLNFKYAKDLSKYIVKNQLGYKYQHISGILTMRGEADEEWDFHGGFPPYIYKIICRELGLDNQRTFAKPEHFIPFSDRSVTHNN